MSVLGVYRPGTSVVHRARAGVKLLVLAGYGVASAFVDRVGAVLAGPASKSTAPAGPVLAGAGFVGLALLGYAVARLPAAVLLRQLRPLLVMATVIGILQWVTSGPARAATSVLVLLGLVLAAALVSLTTPTSAMIDALVAAIRPLHRFGVDPERVGLALGLGIRSVPLVVDLARTIRDAQRARGLTADPRAFAVPLIVRALRHADQLADALRARGLDE